MFEKLDQLKSRLDALRPLPQSVVRNLHEDLVVRWTYHSNAIEGNTLTLQETKVVLEGITIGGRSMREQYGRPVTGQDRLLHSLCRPERFMEIFRKFIVFDAGTKKIARYQQYFAIHKILRRVLHLGPSGSRDGGVVWHTQGSGKSLTMVMLPKCLALHPAIQNPRLVLVTDRVDLDKQIRTCLSWSMKATAASTASTTPGSSGPCTN